MTDAPGSGQAERSTVERYFAAVNARDVGGIMADIADDAQWSWPGSGEVIRGRATIETVVDASAASCTRWLGHAMRTTSSQQIRLASCTITCEKHDVGRTIRTPRYASFADSCVSLP